MYSPVAILTALFLAAPEPWFVSCFNKTIRESFWAYSFKIEYELSVEQSSTQIISISVNV